MVYAHIKNKILAPEVTPSALDSILSQLKTIIEKKENIIFYCS